MDSVIKSPQNESCSEIICAGNERFTIAIFYGAAGNPVFNLRFDPFFELCQKGGIMRRGENTEAQIAFIQEGEGGRIADEHFFLNTFFE